MDRKEIGLSSYDSIENEEIDESDESYPPLNKSSLKRRDPEIPISQLNSSFLPLKVKSSHLKNLKNLNLKVRLNRL